MIFVRNRDNLIISTILNMYQQKSAKIYKAKPDRTTMKNRQI